MGFNQTNDNGGDVMGRYCDICDIKDDVIKSERIELVTGDTVQTILGRGELCTNCRVDLCKALMKFLKESAFSDMTEKV